MKKALIVCTVGGFLGFELNNIKILHEMGYKIHIATNFKGYEYIKEKLLPFETCNIQVDFTRKPVSFSNVKAYKKLEKILAGERIDLVHCHTPVGGVLARLAAKKHRKQGTKVLYTVHGFHFFKGAPIKNWILYYPIEKILSRWTDVLITINKEDYELAKRRFCAKKIEYVPGVGVDVEFFQKHSQEIKARKREELGIDKEKVVLLSIGELSKRKNQKIIIETMAMLKSNRVIYCICGRGEKEEELRKMVKNANIDQKVKFLGYREDVKEICEMADIFIFPSLQEGLPVALMEAMASGMPCIVSNIRGNADLIEQRKGGILCSPKVANEFMAAIIELADNKELGEKWGKYNQKSIEKFSIFEVNTKMRNIYKCK